MDDFLEPSLLARPPESSLVWSTGALINNNGIDQDNNQSDLDSDFSIPCGQGEGKTVEVLSRGIPSTSNSNYSDFSQGYLPPINLDFPNLSEPCIEESQDNVIEMNNEVDSQQTSQGNSITALNDTLASAGKSSVILIKPRNDEQARQLIKNPVKINNAIKNSVFRNLDIKDVRVNNKSNIIAIESAIPLTSDQIKQLTAQKSFGNTEIECYLPNSETRISGVIHPIDINTDLQTLAEEIRADNGANVINVQRLKKRLNNNWEESLSIKITFSGNKCPNFVSVNYIRYSIRPFIENPMQCYNCQRIGHTSKSCKATTPRCLLCGGSHNRNACDNSDLRSCANCKEQHAANSRQCRFIKQAMEIERIKATKQIPYDEARKIAIHEKTQGERTRIQYSQNSANSNNPNEMNPIQRRREINNVTYSQICSQELMTQANNQKTVQDNSTQTEHTINENYELESKFLHKLERLLVELFKSNINKENEQIQSEIIKTAIQNNFEKDNHEENDNGILKEDNSKRKRKLFNNETRCQSDEEEETSSIVESTQATEDTSIWETIEKKCVKRNSKNNEKPANPKRQSKRKKNQQ